MPNKRGRPLSDPLGDVAQQRQRELAAARQRRYQARRRAAAAPIVLAYRPTVEQDEQINRVVDRSAAEYETAQTLAQLGLRVRDMTLAQDTEDAQAQRMAEPVEEHATLYGGDDLYTNALPPGPRPPDSSIARFFTRPASRSSTAPSPPSHGAVASPPQPPPPSRPLPSFLFSHLPPRLPIRPIVTFQNHPPGPSSGLEPRRPSFSPITVRSSTPYTPPPPEPDLGVDHGGDDDSEAGGGAWDPDPARQRQGAPEPEVGGEDNGGPCTGPGGEREEEEEEDRDSDESDNTFYDVLSHHSDEELETPPLEVAVDKLLSMVLDGFHGCTPDDHADRMRRHTAQWPDNHQGLGESFVDPTFPSVLSSPALLSLDRLNRQAIPSHRQWMAMFCGVPVRGTTRRPRQVCLHAEATQEVAPQVAYDIDSFLGFARSLCVARKGILYQPAPQVRQNLQTDVHLGTAAYRTPAPDPEQVDQPPPPPRAAWTMLKDVSHSYLGRVEGTADISLYVLFPHLEPAHDTFTSMTAADLTRWTDQVLHRAIYAHTEAHYNQHLPASYRHALASSTARQVEDRSVEGGNYQGQTALHHFLQPEHLSGIWDAILTLTRDSPGLQDFREPQLFFSAKGTKLQFKSTPARPTALDAMDRFAAYFGEIMDLEHIVADQFYVDLGREICPSVSLLPDERPAVDEQAQVYLWRRCCLEAHLKWVYDDVVPRPGQTFYNVSMLRDACNLTVLTPKRSRLRQGGLLYSQFYSSFKETVDAAKSFPFQNDGLEEMALDPQIRQGARAIGRGRRSSAVVEKAYHASKSRTHAALRDSRRKSFGVREEHRIAWPLFEALRASLAELTLPDRPAPAPTDAPPYVWPVRTAVYADFVWRNVDKYCAGFEVVQARCGEQYVTWEHTKMMAMFLRGLRFALSAHDLSRESALWWSRRDTQADPPRTWYGLGFSNTLPRYGYCWVEPRMDWVALTFSPDVTEQVLFGNRTLRGQYLRRGGQVRDFRNNFLQLEHAVALLQQHARSRRRAGMLASLIVHLCLAQFRVDTLAAVRGEIREELREEALAGQHAHCYEYLSEIMSDGVHLVSGNKSEWKLPTLLAMFLFGFNDRQRRTHWEDKPYRKLYQRACHALAAHPDTRDFVRPFKEGLWNALFRYHWVLPYPNSEVLTQTTKPGQRMWYSVKPVADLAPRDCEAHDWTWARKDWEAGPGLPLPGYLQWTREEWDRWIQAHP